jgi:hypothetical protein
MGTRGPFPRGKAWPGRDTDHSPPSSADVSMSRSDTSSPSMACSRRALLFFLSLQEARHLAHTTNFQLLLLHHLEVPFVSTHTHIHIHMCGYTYVCVCMYMCVCKITLKLSRSWANCLPILILDINSLFSCHPWFLVPFGLYFIINLVYLSLCILSVFQISFLLSRIFCSCRFRLQFN